MPGELQTLLSASLIWLAVLVLASLVGSLLFSLFQPVARLTPTRQRSSLFLGYAILPAIVATAVSSTLYFSGIANLLLPDHCHDGDCSPHAPQFAMDAAYSAMAAAMVMIVVLTLLYVPLRRLLQHRRTNRLFGRLSRATRPADWLQEFHVVDNPQPLAWCAGLIRPRVFVSQGLIDRVDADELKLVLAHEHAHVARRDNLARLLIDGFTRLWPTSRRIELLEEFSVAAEQACDYAASLFGRPGAIARVIGKLEDGQSGSRVTSARIAALEEPVDGSAGPRALAFLILCGLTLAQAFLFARAAHPALEWLSS